MTKRNQSLETLLKQHKKVSSDYNKIQERLDGLDDEEETELSLIRTKFSDLSDDLNREIETKNNELVKVRDKIETRLRNVGGVCGIDFD